jgi:hypothetical protein
VGGMGGMERVGGGFSEEEEWEEGDEEDGEKTVCHRNCF